MLATPGVNATQFTDPNTVAQIDLEGLDKRVVDYDTETVEGRMNRLLDENSEYLQGARDRAKREANARGLVNSTMAVSAGEEVAINKAFEIAAIDAQTYAKAAHYNVSARNQARMFNADAIYKISLAQLESLTRKYVADTSANAQVTSASIHAGATVAAAGISAAASMYRADMDMAIAGMKTRRAARTSTRLTHDRIR